MGPRMSQATPSSNCMHRNPVSPACLSVFLVGGLQDLDDSIFAISAWNDNGFKGVVGDPYSLRRTSYFPGLGWLLTRQLYKEHVRGHDGCTPALRSPLLPPRQPTSRRAPCMVARLRFVFVEFPSEAHT
jgi:hypothetical protein